MIGLNNTGNNYVKTILFFAFISVVSAVISYYVQKQLSKIDSKNEK